MSDSAWIAIALLGIWVAIVGSHAYDSYQENETRRELLKTIQVLQQGGHKQEAIDGFMFFIQEEAKK